MSQSVFGAAAAVTMLNRAFNNTSPANAVFNNQVATAGTTADSQFAFANTFAASFNTLTDAQLAQRVLSNMGVLPNDPLLAAVADYFTATGVASRGTVVLQLGQILAGLETATGEQAIYAPQATAWNTEVEKSFIYSSNSANTTAYVGDFAPTPVDQGQTFTLTTGLDNVTGTGGNDTILGDNNTASAGDQISGGAGVDTLKLFNSSGNPVLPSITGIENVYIKGSTADYNVSTVTGLTSLELDTVNVNGGARIYTLAADQVLTLTNITDSGPSGNDVDVAAAASVTAQTIKLNAAGDAATGGNAVDVDVNGAGVATLNLMTTGTASRINVVNTGAALKTVNISGDKDLTVGDVANATTIAITNTAKTAVTTSVAKVAVTGDAGAETVTLGHATGAAREFKVTAGAGNDTVVLTNLVAASDLTDDKVTLSGGDGTDTLVMKSAMGAALSGLTAAAFAKKGIANDFETIQISDQAGAADDLNLTRVGSNVTTVQYKAGLGDAQTLQGLASGGTVVLGAAAGANTDSLTVTVKDAASAGNNSDVLNITLNAAHAGANADYGVLTAAAVETININSTSTKTTALVAADTNEVDLTLANVVNVTVTGNVYLDIDGAALTGNALSKIDASANTAGVAVSVAGATQGILITGTAKADTIVGGSGADKIVAGAGDDVITGGAGNDELDISGGGSNTIKFGATAAANGADKIVGFNVGTIASGGDVLDVAGQLTGITATTISANLTNLTGAQAVADDSIYTVNFNTAIAGKNFGTTDMAELFAAAGKTFSTTTAAAAQSVILVQGTDETQIYYVDSAAGVATTIEAGEVGLVGVLTGVNNTMTFVNANFA